MAQTHSVGKYYWHKFKYPVKLKGLKDLAETQEIDPPFRYGKGVALRVPFTKFALVVGRWDKSFDEGVALTRAINGRNMSYDEVDWDIVRMLEDDI